MSRSQRDSRPPSNYPRRYIDPRDLRDLRDPRDYEDKREKMERMYDEKIYERVDRYIPQSINSQTPPGYRYEVRRTQSSNYFERFPRSKKYNDQSESQQPYRPPPEVQPKRDRSPIDYVSDVDKISEIIRKEYQVYPPIELDRAPEFSNPKPWD